MLIYFLNLLNMKSPQIKTEYIQMEQRDQREQRIQEIKTHRLLNNLVESPIITLECLVSETMQYDGKIKLIEKAISKKILSHCLCYRDIFFVNLLIDCLLKPECGSFFLTQTKTLENKIDHDKEKNENELLDLIVSWKIV